MTIRKIKSAFVRWVARILHVPIAVHHTFVKDGAKVKIS